MTEIRLTYMQLTPGHHLPCVTSCPTDYSSLAIQHNIPSPHGFLTWIYCSCSCSSFQHYMTKSLGQWHRGPWLTTSACKRPPVFTPCSEAEKPEDILHCRRAIYSALLRLILASVLEASRSQQLSHAASNHDAFLSSCHRLRLHRFLYYRPSQPMCR